MRLERPPADAEELAHVLSADVALASRVLKLANSAFYGMRGRLTAVALERWGFPEEMITSSEQAEDPSAFSGALLRSAFEVAGRLVDPDHVTAPIDGLGCGQQRDADVSPVLAQVRVDAEELRAALLG